MLFSESDYETLRRHAFADYYAGYRPQVQEAPNGDDVWDTAKRYAHVALKYSPGPALLEAFNLAFEEARRVHRALEAPPHLIPSRQECCLRILDYPPAAGSAEHTDFDFFTLQLYRDKPEAFVYSVAPEDDAISRGIHFGEMAEVCGFRKATPHKVRPMMTRQRSIVFFALPARHATLLTAGEWLDERYARSRRG